MNSRLHRSERGSLQSTPQAPVGSHSVVGVEVVSVVVRFDVAEVERRGDTGGRGVEQGESVRDLTGVGPGVERQDLTLHVATSRHVREVTQPRGPPQHPRSLTGSCGQEA